MLNYYRKISFATRLSLNIIIITALIFVIAFLIIFDYSKNLVQREANQNAENLLNVTNLQVEGVLASVEIAVDNISDIVVANLNNPDTLYALTRHFVVKNRKIVGSAIAFKPNYFKSKGYYFAPYSTDFNDIVTTKQLGNDKYDYHKMEWYAVPAHSKQAHWTEPYFDAGGGNTIMTTFSKPFLDKNGEVYAIFTADVALDWLTDMINSIKSYPGSYSFIVGKTGTYIVHPNQKRILNESIFSVAKKMKEPAVTEIGNNMTAGKSSSTIFNNDDTLSCAYYKPINRLGWSLAIVIPYNEIFAGNRALKKEVLIIAIVGLLLILFSSIQIVKRLVKPLKNFSKAAESIAEGNFNIKLPEIKNKDEMWNLQQSFDYMQGSLTKYIDEIQSITSHKERIESELRIAHEIQMGMVPKIFPPFPNRRDIDLFAFLKPAKEVGGDLYDFFIQDEHLYFVIGDVSGKGVPASLFMAITCSLFRSIARHQNDAKSIVQSLNYSISETNNSNMFVTLFVGILDLNNRHLSYCNAGHNAPVVINFSENNGITASYLKVNANIVAGVLDNYQYINESITLENASTLLLYTDGVTEAENTECELFGEDRLLEIAKKYGNNSPQDMINNIVQEISLHAKDAEQSDDITLLLMKIGDDNSFRKVLNLKNNINQISLLAVFMEEIGTELNLHQDLALNLNLALEELVVNIIQYGYPIGIEDIISIKATKENNWLTFTIQDAGIEFDPTAVPETDTSLSLDKREIGGLGIFLVKNIMDKIEYKRINNNNILILKKEIN